jgi:hypothetical protein
MPWKECSAMAELCREFGVLARPVMRSSIAIRIFRG